FIVIAAVSLGMPLVPWPVAAKLGVAAGLGLAATYLAFADRPVFVPALFFVINAAMSPFVFMVFERMAFQVPNTSFLPPIAVYLAAVLSVPSLRDEIRWLRPGAFNRSTVILTVVLVVGSAIALVFWALVIADDLEQFRRFVPSVPVGLLIAYGAGFAATNSFFEEFMARAVLYDGFSALGGTRFAIVAQAVLFSLWHFNGFPGGVVGIVMVFVWSLFLGTIRRTSGGMLAPIVAHFFCDAAIGLILLFVLVLPA
ncbi:MAG: CPBP family intramembrane glutamic endopeptidase, partial [Spirochaetota bacterium]